MGIKFEPAGEASPVKTAKTQNYQSQQITLPPKSEPINGVELEPRVKSNAGRKPAAVKKKALSLRLDQDVIARFKADGDGWQSRMNDALRKAVGL